MDKSFKNFTDAQFYAESVIDVLRKGNIFSQDLITFEQVGDSTLFRVDSKKLIEKITNIINNPIPGQAGMSQPGLPDFRNLCDMSEFKLNLNMSFSIPDSAKINK